eukprot:SAG31_NODE_47_length_30979_cov_41.708841_25_plen_366_part_00
MDLRTALDLRVLAPTEMAELFEELKANKVTLGIRSKIRLLLTHPAQGDAAAADDVDLQLLEHQQRRHMQEEQQATLAPPGPKDAADDSMFQNVIILVSVLLGIGGYMIQAWSAQKADAIASETAFGQEIAQTRRQREHEQVPAPLSRLVAFHTAASITVDADGFGQMVAQITRTERWLDQCCRPILSILTAHMISTYSFVSEVVSQMESEESFVELTSHMASFANAVYSVEPDGSLKSLATGFKMWDASPRTPNPTRTTAVQTHRPPTGTCALISSGHLWAQFSQPFSAVLPQGILDQVSIEPQHGLALCYRRFVKHTLLPSLRRGTDVLQAHGIVMEMPSKDCEPASPLSTCGILFAAVGIHVR